jgi:hypothetical protein
MKKLTSIISLFLTVTMLRADCPTPTSGNYWAPNSGVAYAFTTTVPPSCWASQSIPDLGIGGDIDGAFSQFNDADSTENGSATSFSRLTPPQNYAVIAQSVVDPSDPCAVSYAAYSVWGIIAGTNIVGQASTTFYLGSFSPYGFANYDSTADTYDAFIQKLMAHEIGHTMNLTDQPYGSGACAGQVAGQSIMNVECGTNDSANNLPSPSLGLPDCDNASII